MISRLVLVVGLALVLASVVKAGRAPWRIHEARVLRQQTRDCQRSLRVVPLSGYPAVNWRESVTQRRIATVKYWRDQKQACGTQRRHAGHIPSWLCIHRSEGSWSDGGAPFYGGLQMDYGFMFTYGRSLLNRKGTADHWKPIEQIIVAERARRSGRGFSPWPNTARGCGLL